MLLLTETWNSKLSNIHIDGYCSFSCYRPKSNRKAKRHSGGIIIYFKECFANKIVLVSMNNNGIIWFKLKKEHFGSENDIYICTCYIPPEDSCVYRNANSDLFQYDFFEQLNSDIIKYSDYGDLYLTGDFNARTSDQPDTVEHSNLDRYVDLPAGSSTDQYIPARKSKDSGVNSFGRKLLSLCKENSIVIANGRIEPGDYTCNNMAHNRNAASVVDYLITNYNNFTCVADMKILELTEFSDHAPIEFSLAVENAYFYKHDILTYDEIIWSDTNAQVFTDILNDKKHIFDEISRQFLAEETDINSCIDSLSSVIYDISFQVNGHKFTSRANNSKMTKSVWFNDMCKEAKTRFYECKREFKNNPTDENKLNFLMSRREFNDAKRKAKRLFHYNEKQKLLSLSKSNTRKFWKYINKFKNTCKSKNDNSDISLEEFTEHFKSLSNISFGNFQQDESNTTLNHDEVNIEELDCPFTNEELLKAISTLKRNKSSDYDGNVADFFIECKDFISPYLLTIFNKIYESGIYPDSWCKGVIVPIFKKGDSGNPGNYRGITLINIKYHSKNIFSAY